MDEMESLRIEGELEKQQPLRSPWDQRDSGLADMEATGEGGGAGGAGGGAGGGSGLLAQSPCLKRSALSNSLLDLHDQRECCTCVLSCRGRGRGREALFWEASFLGALSEQRGPVSRGVTNSVCCVSSFLRFRQLMHFVEIPKVWIL
ncbi:hypothetical protein HPB48_005523 [Haemaphysalis longicornis]|uniref:Uncharacterized protein n=1 Tax=Haemaphysalis longicornis TaxID=44386 RepID=A0A9J6GSJ8_HAELO|nr:hypothetical protein HPB48_005523 [Haemaphysalis longicornis]